MRNVKILLAVVGLFLAGARSDSAWAQTNAFSGKLPMWTAQGKSNVVHFVGSIHFLKREFYPLPAPIEQAFTNASIVVFETELDRMSDPATMRKMMEAGTYPVGKTIADDISKETYKALRRVLTEKVGQPALLDRFKPYLVGITLSALEIQRLGYRAEDGVDQYFLAKAKDKKKQIQSLETLEEQMSFFSGMSKAQQEAFLKSTLEEMSESEEMMEGMVEAWKTGNSSKMEELLLDAMKEHPDLMQRLLTDRNKNWIPDVEKYLQGNKNVLVVVGAGHLVGKDNVIELLKAKGIKVEQQSAR